MRRFLILLLTILSLLQISYAVDVSNLPVVSAGSAFANNKPAKNTPPHINNPYTYPYNDYNYGRNMYYGRGYFPPRTVVTTYYGNPYHYTNSYSDIICVDKKSEETVQCERTKLIRGDYICIDKATEKTIKCPR